MAKPDRLNSFGYFGWYRKLMKETGLPLEGVKKEKAIESLYLMWYDKEEIEFGKRYNAAAAKVNDKTKAKK